MNRTSIEWVRNPDGSPGYTFNPITGCLNHINGLCRGGGFPCYAYKLAHGRLKERYLANRKTSITHLHDPEEGYYAISDPFYPRFWPERVRENFGACTSGAEPKGIFVCDMSDLFGIGIPEAWTRRVLNHIGMSWYREHRFYLLTKQPQNLIKFSPFPGNCWVGVTATNDATYMAALKGLRDIQAKIKFLSFEPLLEEVINASKHHGFCTLLSFYNINWVIIGGQTGKDRFYPPEDWIQEIESACDKAKIPVFEKDNLRKVWYNYPRQEMPMEGNYANSRRTQKR